MTEEQIEDLKKDKDYFSDALDKQIDATLKLDQMYQKQKEINKELVDELEEVKEDRNYARSIIADLLRNSDEYARIRASEYLHG